MSSTRDHYEILGISAQAAQDEITDAFDRQLERFPEYARDPIGNKDFRELVIAYQVLSDQERRSAYDRSLGARDPRKAKALNVQLFASQTVLPALNEDQVLHVLIDLSASSTMMWNEPSVNLCLVIDRSTSMKGDRIGRVREAAVHIIDGLKEKDSFSLVSFSDRAEVVVPAGPVDNKGLIRSRISQMSIGGATEILQGIKVGLDELFKARKRSEISHLILLTDGHTYGDEEDSIEMVKQAADDGVGVSALGLGYEWNDSFLDELVAPSGGISALLESPDQFIGFLEQHVQTLNRAFAKDVKFWLDLPPRIAVRSIHKLVPTPGPVEYSNLPMPLGTLQYNSPISALVELVVQPHPPSQSTRLQVGVSAHVIPAARGTERFMDQLTLKFALDAPRGSLAPAVVQAVNKLNLYQMNEKAWEEAERGESEKASRRMERIATHLLRAGQPHLARTAFTEANNLARTGHLSQEGRIKLKYGTRALIGS